MPETMRRQVRECLEHELEVIGWGNPIEAPDSDHRLKLFLVRADDGGIKAKTRRVGPAGQHDLAVFLAVLDVTLQSDENLVARCLQEYLDGEIPTDDNGGLDPDWQIDPETLVEAHEDAWDRHCSFWLDEWVEEAIAQTNSERP